MKLVWLDLETNGLDPSKHVILAFGIRITDETLKTLGEIEAVIGFPDHFDPKHDADPFVLEMHTKTGLWERVATSPLLPGAAGFVMRSFLAFHLKGEKGTLAGNSVHFDRGFLDMDYPEIVREFLTHRHLDVSVFKVLETVWGIPKLQTGEPAHMPLADLDASMKHLEAVRTWLTQNSPK